MLKTSSSDGSCRSPQKSIARSPMVLASSACKVLCVSGLLRRDTFGRILLRRCGAVRAHDDDPHASGLGGIGIGRDLHGWSLHGLKLAFGAVRQELDFVGVAGLRLGIGPF